jgi:hypothetical protein
MGASNKKSHRTNNNNILHFIIRDLIHLQSLIIPAEIANNPAPRDTSKVKFWSHKWLLFRKARIKLTRETNALVVEAPPEASDGGLLLMD